MDDGRKGGKEEERCGERRLRCSREQRGAPHTRLSSATNTGRPNHGILSISDAVLYFSRVDSTSHMHTRHRMTRI